MPAPTAAEQAAATDYERVCWRLGGFDGRVSPEWVDGYLTGVLAGPRAIALEQWLPAMLGDTFERTFADPSDARHAQRALSSRWRELAQQLDAEALVDDPDTVVLEPWIVAYEDADREAFVAQGHGDAQLARDELRSGVAWSRGFVAATEDFNADWVVPDAAAGDGERFHHAFDRIRALQAPADGGGVDERDQQIDEACLAAQQLRLYWVDHAPRPTTRRVDAQPGRNEPCPCGSGLKFKKCHGAAR
ncbi:MAG: UPF0149 family protein [Ideonella sp.]|nr:UPF0149 family protein [Ideonella sp.]MCC7457492.1 UPF0149 family protein [Nitrospira sp.]